MTKKTITEMDETKKYDVESIDHVFNDAGQNDARKENRTKVNKKIHVAIGLKPVSYYLGFVNNILQTTTDTTSNQRYSEVGMFTLHKWAVEDESHQGRMLSVEYDDTVDSILIGDLICIIDTIKGDIGFYPVVVIGILVWNCRAGDFMNFGIDVIPGVPSGVNKIVSVNDNKHYSGIYFSATKILNQPASLIVNKFAYQQDKLLEITLKNKTHSIKMGKPLIESPLYVQCEIPDVEV